MLQDEDLAAGDRGRNDSAIGAACLLGEPLDERGAVDDFGFRFGEGLSLLDGEDAGEIVDVAHDEVVPAREHCSTLLGSERGDGVLGMVCGGNGVLRVGGGKVRDVSDRLSRRRIGDGDDGGRRSLHPLAANKRGGLQQLTLCQLESTRGGGHGRATPRMNAERRAECDDVR
jgi:hypothetical protein